MKLFGKRRKDKKQENNNSMAKRIQRGEISEEMAYAELTANFSWLTQKFAELTALARAEVAARDNALNEIKEYYKEQSETDPESAVMLAENLLKGVTSMENVIELYLKQRQLVCINGALNMEQIELCYAATKNEIFNLDTYKESILRNSQHPSARAAGEQLNKNSLNLDDDLKDMEVVATEAEFELCYEIFRQASDLLGKNYFFNLFSTNGAIAIKDEKGEYVSMEEGFLGYDTNFLGSDESK